MGTSKKAGAVLVTIMAYAVIAVALGHVFFALIY